MSTVRIIGGEFRSRRIQFPDIPGLRPTQDRIRETIFNWLMPYISDAKCLDLFAGSGVLGFEALSRGAGFCCFVENHPQALTALHTNAKALALKPEQLAIMRGFVPKRLPVLPQAPFDIIFLDPPFHQNLLSKTNRWLLQSHSVKPGGLIYMEMEKELNLTLPEGWTVVRQQATSSLIYQLVKAAGICRID